MRPYASAILVFALSAAALGQCPANGLTLGYQGDRLGDPFFLTLSGTPNAYGMLGVDVATGTIPTPIGSVCLGLSAALQLLPIALDGTGNFGVAGLLPAQAGLIGLTAYLQAAVIDPGQPGWSSLSNSTAVMFRSPRVFFAYFGSNYLGTLGQWCGYDVLTNSLSVGPVSLPFVVADAITIPSLGWVAFVRGNQFSASVECYDARTGTPTLSIPLVAATGPHKLALFGNTLLVMRGISPGGLDAFWVPSGAPVFSTTLAAPGGNLESIIVAPGPGRAYMHGANGSPTIFVVNLATGAQLPSIPIVGLNNPSEWVLGKTKLYLHFQMYTGLFGGPAIQVIDAATSTPLTPAPVPLPFNTSSYKLRYGPGQSGDALFLTCANLSPPLVQIDPTTLVPISQIPGSQPWTEEMVLSTGGTEWLISACGAFFPLCTGAVFQTLQVPSMTLTTISPIGGPQAIVPVPSATLRQAVTLNGPFVWPFPTDPAVAPTGGPLVPMPGIAKILVD